MVHRSLFGTSLLLVTFFVSQCYSSAVLGAAKAGSPSFSLSVSSIGTEEADIGHGDQSLQRDSWLFDAKANVALDSQWSLGFNLGYGELNYDWQQNDRSLFGGKYNGWQKVHRYNAGLSLSYRMDEHWTFMLAPQVQYAYVDTASSSDAVSYGVIASGMYIFEHGSFFGVGVAYLNDISEVRIMPYPIISWQITPSWRLGNPFDAGFTGSAGLELSYRVNSDIDFGFGSARRTQRFLLEGDDTTVEVNEFVSFIRASWSLSESIRLTGYAGYYSDGELELNTPQVEVENIDEQGALALVAEYSF